MTKPTFEIIEDGKAIKCRQCGMTSWNAQDVAYRYCGHCHIFHVDRTRCGHCHEEFQHGDMLSPLLGAQPYHWECGLRMVTGGLNHLLGNCSCCGGSEPPDPPGMTIRQAAKAAAEEWLRQHPTPPEGLH